MPITLEEIYKSHRGWLHLEDTDVIDLKLAMEVCRQINVAGDCDKPVWLILVAPSGSAKTDLLETLLLGMPKTTYNLRKMTPNSLVSGNPKAPDLAPQLNQKLVIVVDASRFTSMYEEAKVSIFSQLRDLYDGYAGKHVGVPTEKEPYSGLKVTLLMGAVPAIGREVILYGELGTRFLMYFYSPPKDIKATEMMRKRIEKQKIEEFQRATGDLERTLRNQIAIAKSWKSIVITNEIKKELDEIAGTLAVMRATTKIDQRHFIPMDIVDKERATRSYGQFETLYKALMSLPDYQHENAMRILRHIAYSSGSRLRHKILDLIKISDVNPVPTSEIAHKIKCGYYAVRPHLYILWQLGIVERHETEIKNSIGRDRKVEAWSMPNGHEQTTFEKQLGGD